MDILLIEDNLGDARLVQEMLSEGAQSSKLVPFVFQLTHVTNLKKGLALLKTHGFDLILVDLTLPDSQGLATVKKVCATTSQIPIIVLSGYTDEKTATAAVQEGAQDYLLKGRIDSEILIRSIRYAIERKKTDLQLKQLAFFDHVTGLANHAQLTIVFNQMLKRARRYRENIAVLFLDLDYFKSINDTYGHDIGDGVLKAVGERLQSNTRSADIAARIGGDEFVVVLEKSRSVEDDALFTKKLLLSINEPISIDKLSISIQASIGISRFPDNGNDVVTLLKCADAAMYNSKESGRNRYSFYDEKSLLGS